MHEQGWDAGELPEAVAGGLERFCGQLREALGEELVSVVLYGGLVRGEDVPECPDVNVMVVLERVSLEALDRMAAPALRGAGEIGLSVMTLSADDLERSTDVFPVKFLDMQEHHRLLEGRDLLGGLTITRDHLRLRCEQEIRNLLLRLRRSYLLQSGFTDLLEGALTATISPFLKTVAAALQVAGAEVPTGERSVAAAAARAFDLEEGALTAVLDVKAGRSRPEPAEIPGIYGRYLEAVRRTADFVDGL